LIVLGYSLAGFLLIRVTGGLSITRFAWRSGPIAVATVALLVALVADAVAQAGGGWLLVVPPQIPEKRALIRVYAASSAAEVRAAVDSLPDDEQTGLVTKVYKILAIPTAAARTEAMFDALQDTSAPVPKWRRVASFGSAASCERQRELALQSFELEASRVRSAHPDREELSVEDWKVIEGLSASRKSRCVSESTFLAR
jgi:hypothetical protein